MSNNFQVTDKGIKINGKTVTWCDCPDSTKQHNTWDGLNRNWSELKPGVPSGAGIDRAAAHMCKHMWATALHAGLVNKEDIPTDIPIDIMEYPPKPPPIKWREYKGDTF